MALYLAAELRFPETLPGGPLVSRGNSGYLVAVEAYVLHRP